MEEDDVGVEQGTLLVAVIQMFHLFIYVNMFAFQAHLS